MTSYMPVADPEATPRWWQTKDYAFGANSTFSMITVPIPGQANAVKVGFLKNGASVPTTNRLYVVLGAADDIDGKARLDSPTGGRFVVAYDSEESWTFDDGAGPGLVHIIGDVTGNAAELVGLLVTVKYGLEVQ